MRRPYCSAQLHPVQMRATVLRCMRTVSHLNYGISSQAHTAFCPCIV